LAELPRFHPGHRELLDKDIFAVADTNPPSSASPGRLDHDRVSASEYTATLLMLSSLQAQIILKAISPLSATNIFLNMGIFLSRLKEGAQPTILGNFPASGPMAGGPAKH
jgi:hypothetical protein